MAGEDSLLSRVSVRFATLADFGAVMKINENVFEGLDHLPTTYWDFARDPNSYSFVAELDGEVVGYKAYVMDGPHEAVGVGARVVTRLQGQRIFEKLNQVSLKKMKMMYPDLKILTWAAADSELYSDEAMRKKSDRTLIERWHAVYYDCTANDVSDLLNKHRSLSPTSTLLCPTTEQAEQLLSDPENYTRLFKTGYIVAYFNWLPRKLTRENIRHLVNTHNVLFSMETEGKIAAVSFNVPRRATNGTHLIEVHYYHVKQNADTCISHMIQHMSHGLKVAPPGAQMAVGVRCQLDVDITKVKEFLHGRLGTERSTGVFEYQTGVMGETWLGSSNL